jgi:hypothetical protein
LGQAVGLACLLFGCERPPDGAPGEPFDLAGRVREWDPDLAPSPSEPFDLGAPLDGNQLPLDGGTGLAHLWLTVTDSDTRLPVPSRVIFRPPPGAGFADSITSGSFQVNSPGSATGAVVGPGVLGAPEGVLLQTGQGVVPVPAGSYSLFITRGPEYEAVATTVSVAPGEVRVVEVELDHTVDTSGWLAADLHVHTAASFDSRLPLDRRVISMVTNQVEIIVPTEHNVAVDLQPYIDELGYGPDVVGQVIGDEFNFNPGHGGAYPVAYDPKKPVGGVPPWMGGCATGSRSIDCLAPADAFPLMHSQVPGVTVVTVNHPWWPNGDLGYFTNVSWGAGTSNPLPSPLASAGLFEALEVINGYWLREDAETSLVADWFYLLEQGYRVTALGNSDTHKINWVRAGWPRTWLKLPIDKPGEITGALLADAIRNGRAVASTGPFVRVTADGADIGDLVVPQTPGQVTLNITVDAPSWIKVDTVRVYVSGFQTHMFAVTPGQRPVFQAQLVEPIAGDAWIVVFASGAQPLPPDVVGEYAQVNGFQARPFALTNPIFVDGNGTPGFQPSGAWRGTPLPHPTSRLATRTLPPVRSFDEACRYDGPASHEPPLDALQAVMPLLYR